MNDRSSRTVQVRPVLRQQPQIVGLRRVRAAGVRAAAGAAGPGAQRRQQAYDGYDTGQQTPCRRSRDSTGQGQAQGYGYDPYARRSSRRRLAAPHAPAQPAVLGYDTGVSRPAIRLRHRVEQTPGSDPRCRPRSMERSRSSRHAPADSSTRAEQPCRRSNRRTSRRSPAPRRRGLRADPADRDEPGSPPARGDRAPSEDGTTTPSSSPSSRSRTRTPRTSSTGSSSPRAAPSAARRPGGAAAAGSSPCSWCWPGGRRRRRLPLVRGQAARALDGPDEEAGRHRAAPRSATSSSSTCTTRPTRRTSTALLVEQQTTERGHHRAAAQHPDRDQRRRHHDHPRQVRRDDGSARARASRSATCSAPRSRAPGGWTPPIWRTSSTSSATSTSTPTPTSPGTPRRARRPLVHQGKDQTLSGKMAVAYATYRAPGESRRTSSCSGSARSCRASCGRCRATRRARRSPCRRWPRSSTRRSRTRTSAPPSPSSPTSPRSGDYKTVLLPVGEDGTLSAQASESVVKDILGGTVKRSRRGRRRRGSV